ncbi:MAG: RICIN domain-containing protein [Bacteroidales bacterium]|jgi:glucosylceramidase|nr:RICIN domain-containing protein [Bacteroidales bacterium]
MKQKILMLIICIFAVCCVQTQAQTVQSWKTSCSESKKLQAQTDGVFANGNGSNSAKISINPQSTFQTVDGFGWTMTQGSAYWLMQMTQANRQALLSEVFSQNSGLGSSFIRIGLGATDLSQGSYTYHDNQSAGFSLTVPDLTYLIPVLQEIKTINPDVKLLATPWSAPAWMKDNNYLAWGGRLRTDKYADYAQYFLNYLNAMHSHGLDIYAIAVQNEPLNGGNNPAMEMTKEQQYDFVNGYLGVLLKNSTNPEYIRNVKIIGYDHNCDNTAYPIYVAQSQYIDGTAFHLYGGDISAMTTVHNATGKDVYFTEQYTAANGNFGSDFEWHIKNVMLGSVNNWGKTALAWNFASNENWQPHNENTCEDCKGAVTVNSSTKNITRNVSYYTIAHFSKIAKDGALRIASSSTDNSLMHAAFTNPDGSASLVVFNEASSAKTFDIQYQGNSCTYTLEGKTVASLIWGQQPIEIPVTSVEVSPTSVSVPRFQTVQLTATVLPANATLKAVAWTSSNTNVATVDNTGLVLGIAAGNATITATTLNENKTASAEITVTANTGTGNFPDVYYIYSVYSNKVLDIKDRNSSAGAELQQWECGSFDNDNQRWTLEYAGDSNYFIRSRFSGLYLQAMGNNDGADVRLQPLAANNSQLWNITEVESGIYSIVNVMAQKSLDVDGPSDENGKKLHLWGTYEGQLNRQWRFESAELTTVNPVVADRERFSVFPVPATNMLNINAVPNSEMLPDCKAEIISSSGITVKTIQLKNTENQIHIKNIPEGFYLLRIFNRHYSETHKISIGM